MSQAEPPKTSRLNVRLLARGALGVTIVVTVVMIALKASPYLREAPCITGQTLFTDNGATMVGGIAVALLALLAATQWLVHRLDKRNGKAGQNGRGIVGRYWSMRSQAEPGDKKAQLAAPPQAAAAAASSAAGTEPGALFASVIAQAIALAKEDEKNAARRKLQNADFHETDKSAIRAFMTKQSIFAALTLFLLKAISPKLPTGFPDTFPEWLYVAAAAGFLVTLLAVLVAIQTYSTYVRIQWDEKSGIELLKKGRELDEGSFYALTISLLVALCAYQPWAALVAIPTLGILLYKYYFFTVGSETD
ncbi:MAG: hypothetical protein K0M46_02290 [Thiobacillus sp.]|nr:hypothetical protein [Thiobacillus sp.]